MGTWRDLNYSKGFTGGLCAPEHSSGEHKQRVRREEKRPGQATKSQLCSSCLQSRALTEGSTASVGEEQPPTPGVRLAFHT